MLFPHLGLTMISQCFIHIQVLGGGKCLVTYTPEQAITHEIEVTFNEEQVQGDNAHSFLKA
jgi:hypothetical protein